MCMCVWGGPKGVSNEKFEPCSKSTEVTLLESDPVARRQHGLLDYGGNLAQRVRFAPDTNFHPFRWREIGRSLSIFPSIEQSILRSLNRRLLFISSNSAKRRCPCIYSSDLCTASRSPLLIRDEKIDECTRFGKFL